MRPPDEDDRGEYDCSTCKDTGYVCAECHHADGECTCEDGPELVSCEECAG